MKTIEYIKTLSDSQIEIAFIVLGVYFNKRQTVNNQSNSFKELAGEGKKILKEEDIEFIYNDFTVYQIKELLRIEMYKRGIE